MKKIILVRHANALNGLIHQKDIERNLSTLGKKEALEMSFRLKKYEPIDMVYASTAKRVEETTHLLIEQIDFNSNKILWKHDLYNASPEMINDYILTTENHLKTILIVCHNPGITYFMNSLSETVCDAMPTCGMAVFEVHTEEWSMFASAKKRFISYEFPKHLY